MSLFNLYNLIFLIGLSFILSFIFVRLGISLFKHTGFVSKPNPIVQNHKQPVALGGGIIVVSIILIIITIHFYLQNLSLRIPLTISLVLLLGTLDDIRGLTPGIKLTGQCLTAVIYILLIDVPVIAVPFILLFLVLCQNAWNLIDIMDGLMGGTAIICFLGMILIFYLVGFPSTDIIITALVCIGAIAGFLVWNVYPAKIFLGDSGSLPIGMLVGIIVIESINVDSGLGIPLILIGLVPFFETGFLIIERVRKGLKFYQGSPDHFALRLLNNGYTVPSIAFRVMIVNSGLVISALLLIELRFYNYTTIIITIILLICIIIAYRYLHSLPAWERNK